MRSADNKGSLAAVFVFVSLMVGAGFASGRELLAFFGRFGMVAGVLGFLISCIILVTVGRAVLVISRRAGVLDYAGFMSIIFAKSKVLRAAVIVLVNIFIFIMMSVMFAGFGETLSTASGLTYSAGVVVISGLCFIVFLFDIKGIVRVSAVLAPVLIIGGLVLGLYLTISSNANITENDAPLTSLASTARMGAVYASYNLLTGVAVLASLGKTLKNPDINKQTRRIALFSGGMIFVLGLVFLVPIINNIHTLGNAPLPLYVLVSNGHIALFYVYMAVFMAAIITTAVSSGFAVIEWLKSVTERKIPHTIINLIVTVGGLAFAHVGFATLIDRVYPFFGYLGLFIIAAILWHWLFKIYVK
ncbi:MAG: hypothetical protein FWC95_06350 [Defluviitaleaceae bacterium]|nr:hypothetical protein [Defluviitaleaceae bacterium]